jgi:hypothetical protein
MEDLAKFSEEFFMRHDRYPSTRELMQWKEGRSSTALDKGTQSFPDITVTERMDELTSLLNGTVLQEAIATVQMERAEYARLREFRTWLLSMENDYEARGKINLGKVIDRAKETLPEFQALDDPEQKR